MNTTFKVKCTKSDNKDAKLHIDLGMDCLEGKSEEDIHNLAIKRQVVEIQNFKGSLLRMSNTPEEAIATLVAMGYPNATATVYIGAPVKILSIDDIKKAIAKGTMSKQDLLDAIA